MFITKHGYNPAMKPENEPTPPGGGVVTPPAKPTLDDAQKELVNTIVKERLGEQKASYEKKLAEIETNYQTQLAKASEKPKPPDADEIAKKYVPREDYEALTKRVEKETALRLDTYKRGVKAEISAAIAEIKAIPGSEDLITLGVEPFIKIEDDGTFKVLNESKEITRINGEGKPMSIKELVIDFISKRPFLLPPGAAGAGTGKNGGKGADAKELTRGEFNKLEPKEQGIFLQNGGKLKT